MPAYQALSKEEQQRLSRTESDLTYGSTAGFVPVKKRHSCSADDVIPWLFCVVLCGAAATTFYSTYWRHD